MKNVRRIWGENFLKNSRTFETENVGKFETINVRWNLRNISEEFEVKKWELGWVCHILQSPTPKPMGVLDNHAGEVEWLIMKKNKWSWTIDYEEKHQNKEDLI